MMKYPPPVVQPRPGVHPAQIAYEQARLRGADRDTALQAYSDKLRETGDKPVIPD